MNKFILSLLLVYSTSSLADICGRSSIDVKAHLHEASSRIAFKNKGGLMNGGVCWWHSRLQRSSAYLIEFRPEEAKPSKLELQKIITSLREMKQLVIIPGHADFRSFSQAHQKELQAMLNEWQKIDGFLNFQWIRGLSGKSQLPAGEMIKRMDDVFEHFKKSPTPIWIMAQIKGITAHAFLVLDMLESGPGYKLEVIDSNHPGDTLVLEYQHGDTALKAPKDKYTFVPYVGFQNDFKAIFATLQRSCPHHSLVDELAELRAGEIEL